MVEIALLYLLERQTAVGRRKGNDLMSCSLGCAGLVYVYVSAVGRYHTLITVQQRINDCYVCLCPAYKELHAHSVVLAM